MTYFLQEIVPELFRPTVTSNFSEFFLRLHPSVWHLLTYHMWQDVILKAMLFFLLSAFHCTLSPCPDRYESPIALGKVSQRTEVPNSLSFKVDFRKCLEQYLITGVPVRELNRILEVI